MTLLPGKNLDEVHVILRNVILDLTLPPPYEALSYTWGSPQDTVPMRINTSILREDPIFHSKAWLEKQLEQGFDMQFSVLEIRQNLAVALQHLRFEYKPGVLWIDAVCINQRDIQERSAQVQMMGDIYRSAHQTTIWLGPERDASSLAMETLDDLGSRITVDWESKTIFSQDGAALADPRMDHLLDQRQRTSIVRLLQRPWFERLWIWQEVQLAKSAIVTC